jgi:hypothetical protein
MDALPKRVFEKERICCQYDERYIKRKLPNSNFKIQIKDKENFEKITSINLYNAIAMKQIRINIRKT